MNTPKTQERFSPPSHDEISSAAFSLWEQAGKPAGRDEEFWLAAERMIITRQPPPEDIPGALRGNPAHSTEPSPSKLIDDHVEPAPAIQTNKRAGQKRPKTARKAKASEPIACS